MSRGHWGRVFRRGFTQSQGLPLGHGLAFTALSPFLQMMLYFLK